MHRDRVPAVLRAIALVLVALLWTRLGYLAMVTPPPPRLLELDLPRGSESARRAIEGNRIAAVASVGEDLLVFSPWSTTAYRVSPSADATAIHDVPERVAGVGVRDSTAEVVAGSVRTGEIVTIGPDDATATRTYALPVAPQGFTATLVHALMDDRGWSLAFHSVRSAGPP